MKRSFQRLHSFSVRQMSTLMLAIAAMAANGARATLAGKEGFAMWKLIAIVPLLVAIQGAAPACAAGACCKTCHAGKACGNSCIARDRKCSAPLGCACDG